MGCSVNPSDIIIFSCSLQEPGIFELAVKICSVSFPHEKWDGKLIASLPVWDKSVGKNMVLVLWAGPSEREKPGMSVNSSPSGAILSSTCQTLSFCSLFQWSSIILTPGTSFMEDNFPRAWGVVDSFGMIQVHYIYCSLYFYYYYDISFTSDHQPLDPGVWGPLHYSKKKRVFLC